MSSIQFDDIESLNFQNETLYEFEKRLTPIKPSLKGFDMDKMRSREEQDKSKSPKKITLNEGRFENFYLSKYTPKLSIDFEKILDREKREKNNSPKAFPLNNDLQNPEQIK